MREIVGAQIGSIITNSPGKIKEAVSSDRKDIKFLDRVHMQFMAAMDLGANWENMASGPTLFCIDEAGMPCAPIAEIGRAVPPQTDK